MIDSKGAFFFGMGYLCDPSFQKEGIYNLQGILGGSVCFLTSARMKSLECCLSGILSRFAKHFMFGCFMNHPSGTCFS